MIYVLDFFTQYSQFYIVDQGTIGETDDLEFWSDQALNDRLAYEDGILGITVENDYSTVLGELEILKTSNPNPKLNADHIVEASITINSGILEIQDCPTNNVIHSIPLEIGDYRVRVYSFNLANVYEEGHDIPNDRYRIEIWKDIPSPRKVLKRWHIKY